jgi:hypothetical protein
MLTSRTTLDIWPKLSSPSPWFKESITWKKEYH